MGRSRSGSASSGSSDGGGYKQHKHKGSDDGHGYKKEKKDKKDKKDKKEDKDKKDKKDKKNEFEIPGLGKLPGPAGAILGALSPALAGLAAGGSGRREVPGSSEHQPVGPGQQPLMPAYAQASHQSSHAPGKLDPNQIPQWARILHTGYDLPPPNEVGFAACSDIGGEPLFLVLVPMGGGVHPAKMVIRPGSSRGEVYVSYAGNEVSYDGEFALVPFDPQRMHWVPSPGGNLPHGARPVDAGREAEGQPLYHALGFVNGGRVPGKAAPHIGGASVSFGGEEVGSAECEILCWN